MKKIILTSLIGLYLPAMLGSADPKIEFEEFLKSGDVATILVSGDNDDDNVISEQVAKWAGSFPTLKEFGAYYRPDDADQTTLLGKCLKSKLEKVEELIQYLVDDCDAQLDVGPEGKTPRDFFTQNDLKEEWAYLFNPECRFVRIVERWLENEYPVAKVIEIAVGLKFPIDTIKCSGDESVQGLLVAKKAAKKDIAKVLAYCAPFMHDKYAAFAYLAVGCCQFPEDEVPLALLSQFMKENPDLETTRICESFKTYSGKECDDYFTATALAADRCKEVHAHLKKYFARTKGSNSAHPHTFWVTQDSEGADVAMLLVDCARNSNRVNELARYLENRKGGIFTHEKLRSLEGYFTHLDNQEYTHKDTVMNMINASLFAHLLMVDELSNEYKSAVGDFLQDAEMRNLDIDVIPYEGATIGKYVDDNSENNVLCKNIAFQLQPYRSNPAERVPFLTALAAALEKGDQEVDALTTFLNDKMLNVDRLTVDKDTVAQFLGASTYAKGPDLLALPVIHSYRDDALCYKSMFERALDDKTQIDGFRDLCSWFKDNSSPYDVDTLLFSPGKTVGEFITEQLGTGRRENALKIAELVQDDRSDKDAIVRTLFKSIERGGNTDELKTWCAAFPTLDLGAITYDPVDPKNSDTIGSIIDTKYTALAKELGRTASHSPSKGNTKGKAAGWSSGQKLRGFALLVGAGIGYYYYMHKASKENAKDQNGVAAV